MILLHDTDESTAEALPRIIAQYSAAGFSFATVREMLADKYDVEPDSIQTSPKAVDPGSADATRPAKEDS